MLAKLPFLFWLYKSSGSYVNSTIDKLFQIGILGGMENFGKKFAIEWV
jgi:hypothetical protein